MTNRTSVFFKRVTRTAQSMAIVLVLAGSVVSAQIVKSSILGTITDETGAVIPGVTVTVTNVKTDVERTALTSEIGSYEIDFLDSGVYRVTAEQPGFKTAVEPSAILDVATKLRVDLQLQIGQPSEIIEVRAAVPLVDTETTTVAQTLKAEQMAELPLSGRNYQLLSSLMPTAVTPIDTILNGFFGGVTQGVQPTIAGQRGGANSYTMDGINLNGALLQEQSLVPSLDTIEEFRVQSHNFQAEYGRGTVQFTTTTKSGSNKFHGTLYWYNRNSAYNANSFFNNRIVAPDPNPLRVGEKNYFNRNTFGGNIGGPIWRERTFFFFGYEGIRQHTRNVSSARAASAAWWDGDFSDTQPVIDPWTGETFPNNQIPAERFNSASIEAKNFIITPNVTDEDLITSLQGRNHLGRTGAETSPNFWTFRIDHEFSEKDRVYGRYMQSAENLISTSLLPMGGTSRENNGRNAMVSYTRVINPQVINELRGGYNRGENALLQEGAYGETNYVKDVFGIKNTGGGAVTYGLPNFAPTGYAGIGGPGDAPSVFDTDTWQVSDNLIMNFGAHSLKTGFDIQRTQLDGRYGTFSRGLFYFNGQFSGNPIADLLLGISNLAQSSDGEATGIMHTGSYQFYFQDDWRLNPRLTLNLGLRYEYYDPWSEENGRLARFDYGAPLGSCFGSDCPSGQIVTPAPGEGITDPDRNNFGPRIGLAWSPWGDNRAVIRAGYGIFYSPLEAVEATFNLQTPPNVVRFAVVPLSNTDLESTNLSNLFPASEFDRDKPLITGPDWPLEGRVNIFSTTKDFADMIQQHWELTFQRELVPNLLLEVGYQGTHGYNGQRVLAGNQARLGSEPLLDRTPYPQLANWLRLAERTAHNFYNAGTLRLERRFQSGFSFLGSYTFARTIDDFGNVNDPNSFHANNTYDKAAERGLSSFHAKHRFTAAYIYELPFGYSKRWGGDWHPVVEGILGGWQVSGITTFQSGNPLTIRPFPRDWAQVGTFAFAQRADRGSEPFQRLDPKKNDLKFFNADAFTNPELGTFGDTGRGIVIGPGINNWDLTLAKRWSIYEDVRLQFRVEFYNAFNHTQFSTVQRIVDQPAYAEVTGTRAPRNIQLALRLQF